MFKKKDKETKDDKKGKGKEKPSKKGGNPFANAAALLKKK